jgi:hypothetical protein
VFFVSATFAGCTLVTRIFVGIIFVASAFVGCTLVTSVFVGFIAFVGCTFVAFVLGALVRSAFVIGAVVRQQLAILSHFVQAKQARIILLSECRASSQGGHTEGQNESGDNCFFH